jgi:HD-GYP domain-containing protein (c-di-GMP phosphodiesterase class II)
VSLVLVSATGFGLSRYLAYGVRNGEIDDAADNAQSRIVSLITSRLSPEQLLTPLSGAEYTAFDEFVQEEIIRGDTLRVDIWRWDGTLLYSSEEPSRMGQMSPAAGNLADALRGDVGASVQTVDSQQQLAVYAPLVFDDFGGIAAALEIRELYAPVAARIQRFETTVYVGVAGAMGFLYAALLIIVMRGTHAQGRYRHLLVSRSQELKRSHESLLQVLSIALDLRDRVSKGHSLRVARIALAIGRELELSEEELTHLHQAAMLHELGRIVLPESILKKAGPLSDAEWEEVQKHPEVAYQIVRDAPFLQEAGEIIYSHHERWDGGGYPRGIRGPEIPLAARIFAVADAYDAITSDRHYRRAASHASAVVEIERHSGTQFDPKVVEAFLRTAEKGLLRDLAASDGKNGEPAVVNLVTQTAEGEKGHA